MNLLLDTHALLWFLAGDSRLTASARMAIEDLENTRLFSIAGAWEIAIKASLASSPSPVLSTS
ncbi:type II toxin-antitoxin system VapC family toxin [Longimicrobium sp.]|uniref:type II toxin-antitoxin system VapC family toxin n=1 Tax=Longimicrobium sp. TaxID=2029185 RepID=UPI003B3AA714